MIKIVTDSSSGSNFVRKAANYTLAGSLAVTAIVWDWGVPQMIYDQIHPRLAPEPWVQVLPRRDPPDWLTYVSSDHALLLEKVYGG